LWVVAGWLAGRAAKLCRPAKQVSVHPPAVLVCVAVREVEAVRKFYRGT